MKSIGRTSIVVTDGTRLFRTLSRSEYGEVRVIDLATDSRSAADTEHVKIADLTPVKYAPVGAIVRCSYWRYDYEVVEHCANGEVKVKKVDNEFNRNSQWAHEIGKVWTHRTPLDTRDRIVSLP